MCESIICVDKIFKMPSNVGIVVLHPWRYLKLLALMGQDDFAV